MLRLVFLCQALLGFCLSCVGANSALIPLPRPNHVWNNRDGETWIGRHREVVKQAAKGDAELIFIGDSITHDWNRTGKSYWEKRFAKYKPINMGFGGDRTQHVLWRLDNGEVDGINPKLAVVMIGTNNWRSNTPEEIAEGVEAVCQKIQDKLPSTEILLLAIFPRNDREGEPAKITNATNPIIEKLGEKKGIHFLNINERFLDENGNLTEEIMPDGLHPSHKGYEIWADAISPKVERLMK